MKPRLRIKSSLILTEARAVFERTVAPAIVPVAYAVLTAAPNFAFAPTTVA